MLAKKCHTFNGLGLLRGAFYKKSSNACKVYFSFAPPHIIPTAGAFRSTFTDGQKFQNVENGENRRYVITSSKLIRN